MSSAFTPGLPCTRTGAPGSATGFDATGFAGVVAEHEVAVTPAPEDDLTLAGRKTARWTRLGSGTVVGDAVTESVLGELAESVRAAAYAEGRAAGWAQGCAEAAAEARTAAEQAQQASRAAAELAEARVHEQVAALRCAAEQVYAQAASVAARLETHATDLALNLTRAILDREVRTVTDGGDAVRRALQLLPADGPVRVHLAPGLSTDLDLGPHISVVHDPTLGPADVMVETDSQIIDARVHTALERVRAELEK